MPRVFQNKAGNQPTNLMDHSDDATQRGVRNWMHDEEYDRTQNHIIFDFESVTNGLNEPGGDIDKSDKGQEPYELGLSVRDRNGNWQHKSFMFTPLGINDGFNGDRQLFSPSTTHHRRAMGFPLEQSEVEEGGWIENAPAWAQPRLKTIEKTISPYTRGKGERTELDWGEINNWLEGHGVEAGKKTNFIAHNGRFDFPLLERLMVKSNAGKDTADIKNSTEKGLNVSKLYNAVHSVPSTGFTTETDKTSKFFGQTFWNGAWSALTNTKSSTRVGDQRRGVYFQDTIIELSRLLGETDDTNTKHNDRRLVLRKAGGTRGYSRNDPKEYYAIGYSADHEKAGSRVRGGSLDAFRNVIAYNAFNTGATNPAKTLFTQIAKNISDGTRNEFIDNLGLTQVMKDYLDPDNIGLTFDARDCFDAFNAVSGHSGAGDTAFMGEILMPFMTDLMDTFDHRGFRGPDADGLNDVQTFTDGFDAFQTRWGGNKDENTFHGNPDEAGGILGAYPVALQRNKPRKSQKTPSGLYYRTVPALRKGAMNTGASFPSELITAIITNLRDGNAWIDFKEETKDAKGNIQTPEEGNPLSQRSFWLLAERKRKAKEEQEAENAQAKEENREPEDIKEEDADSIQTEFEVNPDNQPDETQTPDNNGNSDSTSLDHLNERLGWEHGAITFAKWQGYKHHDQGGREPIRPENEDLIIASVPIGNSRVAFRESRKTVDGVSVSTFKPFLGITSFKDENDKITERAIDTFVNQMLAGHVDDDNPIAAPWRDTGKQIAALLGENLGAIREHLSPHDSLTHENINKHINTPASAWLNKGLIHGQELTKEDIEGPNFNDLYWALSDATFPMGFDDESWLNAGSEDEAAMRNELMDQYLAAPHLAPRLFGHLRDFREEGRWYDPQVNPSLLEQFQNKGVQAQDISEAGGDELFQTDQDMFAQQQVGVNLQQLKQLFLKGHGVEGMHPHQFLYDHPDGDFDPATAFTRFMMFMYEVQQEGLDPGVALGNSRYTEAAPLHNLEEPISLVEHEKLATTDDGGDGSSAQSAKAILANNDPKKVAPAVQVAAGEKARREAAARARLREINKDENDGNKRHERVKATIEELGLNSSPFIIQNNIQTPEAEASLEDAYNSLFSSRDTYMYHDGVQTLLDEAVALYGQDGEKPSALNLARELEWIRINHTGDQDRYNSRTGKYGDPVLASEELENALVDNDRESVAGQWLDLFNSAYQAMGDFGPENIALLQEEVKQMGDTFMNNAHKDFLWGNHEDRPGNWVDVPEPISIQEQFTPPEEEQKESRSFRQIARDMAIGTAKVPLNALKYYVNWNEVSQQTRDAFSGREQAGRKLLEASRRGEPLEQVNIGTPEKPKTVGSVKEFNHYIENISSGSETQPSLVSQFLFGRQTYGGLAAEKEESAKTTAANIRSSVKNLHDHTMESIQSRIPQGLNITPEVREEAAGRVARNQQEQSAYTAKVKQAIQQGSPEEPSIGKSLDGLREYLSRV